MAFIYNACTYILFLADYKMHETDFVDNTLCYELIMEIWWNFAQQFESINKKINVMWVSVHNYIS